MGGRKVKHLQLGPGNEGVFLRDDSQEEDQREREVKQRDYITSRAGYYNNEPSFFGSKDGS